MSNPFLVVQAGVFAGIPAARGGMPVAAQICAALAGRIAIPPADAGPLDQAWWTEAFNSVPLLSAAATVIGSIADATPAGIAAACLGRGVAGDAPGGRGALAGWIGAIRPRPTLLDSIAVTGTGGTIHLSLAFVDIGAGSFTRTDAIINASGAANASSLESLFGSTGPLTSEPYYCSLQSVG